MFEAMKSKGLPLSVYVFSDKRVTEPQETSFPVVHSKCFNRIDRYFFHLKHGKVLRDIQQRMKIDDYDRIHAHSLFSNGYIALKLKQKYDIPYVVAVRNTDLYVFFRRMPHLRKLGVSIMENAEKILFLSKPYMEQTLQGYVPESSRERLSEKSVVIPNGVDTFWLSHLANPKSSPEKGEVRLVYAGRISLKKNTQAIIRACHMLISKGYNARLLLIGDIMDPELGNLISQYPFVRHEGFMPKEELMQRFRDSDIFVMPSRYETFGLVYVEAMTQGLPVIYTSGQGFDRQFEDGVVGYPVDPDRPEDIADKIVNVLQCYDEISKACIDLSPTFDWNSLADAYMKLYQSMPLGAQRHRSL